MSSNEESFKRINLDLIRTRSKEIRHGIQTIRNYLLIAKEEFLSNPERIAATKYEAIVVIEASIAICNHLAVRFASRTPESYSDCFQVLKEESILSDDLAKRLTKMAQFRNRIIHRYWLISDDRIYTILKSDLKDLEEYLTEIGEFISNSEL